MQQVAAGASHQIVKRHRMFIFHRANAVRLPGSRQQRAARSCLLRISHNAPYGSCHLLSDTLIHQCSLAVQWNPNIDGRTPAWIPVAEHPQNTLDKPIYYAGLIALYFLRCCLDWLTLPARLHAHRQVGKSANSTLLAYRPQISVTNAAHKIAPIMPKWMHMAVTEVQRPGKARIINQRQGSR